MKVAELLELRRQNWQELERFCDANSSRSSTTMWLILASLLCLPITVVVVFLGYRRGSTRLKAAEVSRFAALYRAACADLALADAYQLPPNTVQYLHRLVGRAHNQIYRSRRFEIREWGQALLFDTPRRIVKDGCFWFAMCLFWGVFIGSACLAYSTTIWPEFANEILPEEHQEQLIDSFSESIEGRAWEINVQMAGFYIQHNTTIGLQCFVSGLFVIPGLLITLFNAAHLGASFGFMFRQPVAGENFLHFVTAHGPFELTAIVLSAASGLRIGLSAIRTRGLTRIDSITETAKESLPMVFAAVILFFLAAMIEGFISPSGLPYWFKVVVAVVSSVALFCYFIVFGFFMGAWGRARSENVGT